MNDRVERSHRERVLEALVANIHDALGDHELRLSPVELVERCKGRRQREEAASALVEACAAETEKVMADVRDALGVPGSDYEWPLLMEKLRNLREAVHDLMHAYSDI